MGIKELTEYLEKNKCDLKACSGKQISKIEESFNVSLPVAYKEFLLVMGKGAGQFMLGSSVFYNEIFDLREGSIELLSENDFKELPENTFVFWMHQGYQFAFFYLDQGENPPVYFYYEGETKGDFELVENSFTDFLEKQLVMSAL
jgi:hypothetical protein